MNKQKLKCASFFAGVGGIDLGFEQTDSFETIYVNELDEYAVKTFEANFHIKVDNRDIREVKASEIPDFDVMLAGFPCLTGDTLVLTKDGYKELINIKPGDMVLSHDNQYHEVLRFMEQGIKPIVKIIGSGFDEIKATTNHKFYVRRKKYVWNNQTRTYERVFEKPEWMEVAELMKFDEKGSPNYKNYYLCNVVNQDNKIPIWNGINVYINQHTLVHKCELDLTSPDFWYLVGRYMGDGWIKKNYKKGHNRNPYSGIIICCGKNEKDNFESKISLKYKYTLSEEKTVYRFHFSSVELASFLAQFGTGAKNKFLPGFMFDLPANLLRSFLDGYFDADGCYFEKIGIKQFTTTSKKLCYGIAQCMLKAYQVTYDIHYYETQKTTKIEGRTVNQNKFYIGRFKTHYQRKCHRFYEDGYYWYPISKIEELNQKEPVYDIEVKDSHSFVANNCITHNCQPFSLAGYQQGFNDEKGRGTLFFELVRIMRDKKPSVVFFENVKNLVTHDNGNTFRIILEYLDELGYHVKYKVMNAKDYGNIPHGRERVYIVGFKDIEQYHRFEFPEKVECINSLDKFIDFETRQNDKYYYTKDNCSFYDILEEQVTRKDTVYQWRRKYVRENKSNVCPTLTANMGTGGHNVPIVWTDFGIRKLTPRETFNLQGFPKNYQFPDDMKDSRLYKQAGNSVVVSVIRRIAECIVESLDDAN